MYYLKLAAEQGNPEAQFQLAVCYFRGNGVEENIEEHLKWLKRAADQGHQKAIEALEMIENL